jgi:hypothetical protein
MSELLKLAKRLTPGMRKALFRLDGCFIVSDGRSSRALVRRGLARPLGVFSDALLGDFTSYAITERGKEVAAALRSDSPTSSRTRDSAQAPSLSPRR